MCWTRIQWKCPSIALKCNNWHNTSCSNTKSQNLHETFPFKNKLWCNKLIVRLVALKAFHDFPSCVKSLTWKMMAQWGVRFPDGGECLKPERSLAVQRQTFPLNNASKWEPIISHNYCWLRSLCHVLISWRHCWWFGLNGSYGFAATQS